MLNNFFLAVAVGLVMLVVFMPRDYPLRAPARMRKPPHTTRAIRQSIMMAMVPPDRMRTRHTGPRRVMSR